MYRCIGVSSCVSCPHDSAQCPTRGNNSPFLAKFAELQKQLRIKSDKTTTFRTTNVRFAAMTSLFLTDRIEEKLHFCFYLKNLWDVGLDIDICYSPPQDGSFDV